jgi:hypothetical protein
MHPTENDPCKMPSTTLGCGMLLAHAFQAVSVSPVPKPKPAKLARKTGKAGALLNRRVNSRRDADDVIAIPCRPLRDCMRWVEAVATR